jgi:hypothetical protein
VTVSKAKEVRVKDRGLICHPTEIVPKKGKAQKCYSLAMRFVLNHEGPGDVSLVHGLWGWRLQNHQGVFPVEHAWVDLGNGVIYEPVSCQYIEKAWSESRFHTIELARYTPYKTARLVLEHNHAGPWAPTPRAAYDEFFLRVDNEGGKKE